MSETTSLQERRRNVLDKVRRFAQQQLDEEFSAMEIEAHSISFSSELNMWETVPMTWEGLCVDDLYRILTTDKFMEHGDATRKTAERWADNFLGHAEALANAMVCYQYFTEMSREDLLGIANVTERAVDALLKIRAEWESLKKTQVVRVL